MTSSSPSTERIRRCQPWLGTLVEISAETPRGWADLDAAFEAVAHVHRRMSFHTEDSDLAALRRAPAGQSVPVSPDTVAVLRLALDLHGLTDGLFDVAVGRTLVAAGFLPHPDGRGLRHMTGTASDIEIIDDTHVRCHRPMLVDLGGIAKGYAADLAIDVLKARGAVSGIVNAGGDIGVFGPGYEPIDIRNGDGQIVNRIGLQDRAIATSSNTGSRRRFRGRTVTPHLGRNRQAVLTDHTISVIAPNCMVADALTKVAMADATLAERLLARYDGDLVISVTPETVP